jgi:hypothetical protein
MEKNEIGFRPIMPAGAALSNIFSAVCQKTLPREHAAQSALGEPRWGASDRRSNHAVWL